MHLIASNNPVMTGGVFSMYRNPPFQVLLTLVAVFVVLPFDAKASSVTYEYTGNNFTTFEGTIFTSNDRVTARFTIDCALAHAAGDCRNLPAQNYYSTGAVDPDSVLFSAGPATLPTADGSVNVRTFHFTTDSLGQIVDWDLDLYWPDPSGIINVDTDNVGIEVVGIDSAAALGGGAVVSGEPGTWSATGLPIVEPKSIPTIPIPLLILMMASIVLLAQRYLGMRARA
jgi:hypothetical protein